MGRHQLAITPMPGLARIFSLTPGGPRLSSPKRRVPQLSSSHRISDFHFPETTSIAASIPQMYGPHLALDAVGSPRSIPILTRR